MAKTTARSREKCTSGCDVLDALVLGGGGFPSGSLTELVGESGAAKTQLVLQLLVAAQLPPEQGGRDGRSICFYTEGYFAHRRLRQIASSFRRAHKLGYDPCKNVLVEPVESVQDAFSALERLEKMIVQQRQGLPVRLLAIDSVAALFRSEFENNRAEMVVRAGILFQLGAKLKALAQKLDLVVVVTNQVMDCINDDGRSIQVGNLPDLISSGRKVAPALGLAWSHCINSRLFLSRHSDFLPSSEPKRCRLGPTAAIAAREEDDDKGRSTTRRALHVVFAPHLPYSCCEFVVDEDGVHGVDGSSGDPEEYAGDRTRGKHKRCQSTTRVFSGISLLSSGI